MATVFLLPMTIVKSQQFKISFEASEGYILGDINDLELKIINGTTSHSR